MADDFDDLDRKAILARRRRFVAVALTGLAGTTVAAAACPCLKMAPPPGTEPMPAPEGESEGAKDSEGDEPEVPGDAPRPDHQDDGDPLEEAQPGE